MIGLLRLFQHFFEGVRVHKLAAVCLALMTLSLKFCDSLAGSGIAGQVQTTATHQRAAVEDEAQPAAA
jgi:hypothetical protein